MRYFFTRDALGSLKDKEMKVLKKKKKKINNRVARFENYEKSLPLKLVFVHCSVILDCIHKYEIIVILKAMKFDKLTSPPPCSNLSSVLVWKSGSLKILVSSIIILSIHANKQIWHFLFWSVPFFFNLCLSRCESFILLSNKLDLGIGSFEEIVFGWSSSLPCQKLRGCFANHKAGQPLTK